MAPFVPILVGAAVGAGVAEATGGKWEKGAMFGAVGGLTGAAINPYSIGASSMAVSSGTVGAVAGGAAGGYAAGGITKMMSPPPMPPMTPTSKLGPAATTVMAGERAGIGAERLLKKRKRISAMNRDYGALNLQTEQLGT